MDFFHILSRGIEKRKIFLDKGDYFRFIHDLYEFNDEEPSEAYKSFKRKFLDVQHPDIGNKERVRKKRKLLVNLHAFALMPNHYHLLLSPLSDGAITLFMRKLNGGYARYFNQKNERKGPLFESRFKSILVSNEKHFIHLPYYIHCNPLDLKMPEWRKREIKSYKEAIEFLRSYRWSSHIDYIGEKNFPSVTQRESFLEYFGGEDGYKNSIKSWLNNFDKGKLDSSLIE